jgi:hypothetical protein
VIADNGYLNWSTTMPPLKHSTNGREIRWSKWIQSMMRKDVECTFGILKGRFRILKSGICLQGTINADNWLLEVDGLDVRWEHVVSSHWQGEDGKHRDDKDGIASHFALGRLHLPADSCDMSCMGMGADYEPLPEAQRLMRGGLTPGLAAGSLRVIIFCSESISLNAWDS